MVRRMLKSLLLLIIHVKQQSFERTHYFGFELGGRPQSAGLAKTQSVIFF